MRSLGPEEEMPCWYYDKKEIRTNTPSFRDGLSPEVEQRYRKEGARFITNTGTKLGLRHIATLATGIVYFHRFYMIHSFKQFPRYVTACCCLFLAGKVEETPKKCKDIIKAARSLLNDQQFAQFGEDPKEEVMTLERILLQTMKFDLQVDHPHKYLLRYAKCFKGDKQKIETMVQMGWNFINDSLFTTLCLQWEPEIIAIALLYLATKLSKFEVSDWNGRLPKHFGWWDMYVEDISIELLEDVCHQILDYYSKSEKGESPSPTTPPPASRQAQVRPNEHNPPSHNNSPSMKKPKMAPLMHPTVLQPKSQGMDPTKMEQTIMDPSVQMQAHLIPNQGETSAHANLMHSYKYATPMAGLPEGFVPPGQYIPSPNAPFATFGEMAIPTQAVLDGSYATGYYDGSAFPGAYAAGAGALPPPPYPPSVPLHYMTEPPAFGGVRPAQPSQFPAGVYPPPGGVYPPPPGFVTSPVPRPSGVHMGMPRGGGGAGGVVRMPTRHATHQNWGV